VETLNESDVHFPATGRDAKRLAVSFEAFQGWSSPARDIHGEAHGALKKFDEEQGEASASKWKRYFRKRLELEVYDRRNDYLNSPG